jgi:probable rRNA maturation factor
VPIALSIEKGPHEGIARTEVMRRLKAMIRLLQLDKAEVSFVLTDDDAVHELNKVYRGKDRPTDVLAFAMHEGEFSELAGHVLGDVIVSVPTARKQAHSRRTPVLEEVTMLLAHGLLHLLGWDHDTAAKDRRMRAETARLCAAAVPPSAVSKEGADRGLTRKRTTRSPQGRTRKGE